MAITPAIEQAINRALEQARDELIRLYSNGYVGKVELNCGKDQIRVKALPEQVYEPVKFIAG